MADAVSPKVTAEQRRGMLLVVLAQCCGGFAGLIFAKGMALLYLLALGVPDGRALVYVSLATMGNLISVFFAHVSDRLGLKRIGTIGLMASCLGVLVLPLAPMIGDPVLREAVIIVGILGYSLGGAALAGTWFPLLRPLIPEHLRGRFFGILRFSWQLVGVGFIALCSAILAWSDAVAVYAWIMAVVGVGQIIRLIVYLRIPELVQRESKPPSLRRAMRETLQWPGFTPLMAYVFLLGLTTAGAAMCFSITEKTVLKLSDGVVVLLGNLSLVGGVVGFLVGGMVIDRWGSRLVFVVAHLGAAIAIAAFVGRGAAPVPILVWLGAVHALLGFLTSAVSVAVTTEQMRVLPETGRSVALALASTASIVGGSLSGILAAALAGSGMLQTEWSLFGTALGAYDAVLVLYAGAVLVLVVTLGLVPSVLGGRHQLLPMS